VLRDGAIDAETISRLLDRPIADASGPSRAAGMMASHYAPDCRVVLAETAGDAADLAAAHRSAGASVRVLDRTSDLVVAARRLYDDLRAADRDGVDVLVAVLPPPRGLGHAVRDRLTKAAAAGSNGATAEPG
jgi:L-threonylcarbamoyladenylate synthase